MKSAEKGGEAEGGRWGGEKNLYRVGWVEAVRHEKRWRKKEMATHFVQGLCVNEYPANLDNLGGVFGNKDGVLVAGGGDVDDDVAVDTVGDEGGEGGEGGDGRLRSDGLLGSGHV
jgi:hypothetical protein